MVERDKGRREVERRAVMFVVYKDGCVLIEHRNIPDKSYYGYDIFPGGKVDETDGSPLDALLREIEEELGVRVDSETPVLLDTFQNTTPTNTLYEVTAFFVALRPEDVVVNVEGKSDHQWVPIGEALDRLLFVESRHVLNLAIQHLTSVGQTEG